MNTAELRSAGQPGAAVPTWFLLQRDWSQQEVPGFLIAVVAGVFAVGRQQDVDLGAGGGDGQNVPDVGRDDISGDEFQLVLGVGHAVGGNVALIRVAAAVGGALDLDTMDASAAFDHEVVGGGVSPGTGDHEAVLGGAGHEAEFGPLAAQLAVFDEDR
jgi:hypothetical protein